jgi:hypothetical protein
VKRLIALMVVVLLLPAPAAEAKATAQVCGATRCETVTDPGVVGPLRSTFGPARAPKPSPFYLVRFCSNADCRGRIEWSYLYVPSARTMRANNMGSGPVRWMHASLLQPLLVPVTKGLEPYSATPTWSPAPRVTRGTSDTGFPLGWVALAVLGVGAIGASAAAFGRPRRERVARTSC